MKHVSGALALWAPPPLLCPGLGGGEGGGGQGGAGGGEVGGGCDARVVVGKQNSKPVLHDLPCPLGCAKIFKNIQDFTKMF